MHQFSEIVKESMAIKNLKNVDLAKLVGHSPQYISELISGKRRWNEDSMSKVCSALNIRVNYETEKEGSAKE